MTPDEAPISPLDSTEARYLLDLWDRKVCPYCGKEISPGILVGTGRQREGGFCSLNCYAAYYEYELKDRLKMLTKKQNALPQKAEDD